MHLREVVKLSLDLRILGALKQTKKTIDLYMLNNEKVSTV